ncbi:PIKK family atypical protein kinase [Tritrichomonas foetus]|uniref:Serine/threonine-protein kinase TOR n=1 Tax=Tritrichomonas foetus TaxID=1144522 RepID=A0A1J4KDQ8_9EUKA|nr:PIKK family atypical protein kinase [Tritrichomonas foetus]|eukprot:OHT09569.1 PIKK family atypical protein kinase [Tritrichomonas foetus]
MVRQSNTDFKSYVEKYFDLLLQLARDPRTTNSIRAAIGVVCLHQFGYHEFRDLTNVFDRVIPQIDIEYIKFTSWCVGRLIEHPNSDKSRYAAQLFIRALSWTRSKGRRARPLAAAHMLDAVSFNAGSIAVTYFSQLQTAIWSLVSHPSLLVLNGTAMAISSYTRAIIRFVRNDLDNYMSFFSKVFLKLLFFDDPIRQYGALCMFDELVNGYPAYFVPIFINVLKNITELVEDRPLLVQGQAYVVISSLAQVNPSSFIDCIAEELFGQTNDLLLEFPFEVTKSLCRLCKFVPDFIVEKIEEMKVFARDLIKEEPDCAFRLLTTLIKYFQNRVLPIDIEFLQILISLPLSEDFKNFFVALTKCSWDFFKDLPEQLCSRLIKELDGTKNVVALEIIAKLPNEAMYNHEQLMNAVWQLAVVQSIATRCAVPNAIYNIIKSTDIITVEETSKKFLQLAIYEPSIRVRCAILQALIDNVDESLAGPDFHKYYQIFINDDSSTVRELFYKLLKKLAHMNPMAITSLTRSAMLDSFFVIRKITSIRKRARTIRGLPVLIQACEISIKAYSGSLMDIFMNIFKNYNPKAQFENFLEEDAQTSILIGVTDSICLLAPMDPEAVSKHAYELIPILCDIVLSYEHRLLTLFIFELFFVLLSAPASTIEYRIQVPLILSTCSTFLAQTRSRKGRMAVLKVLGAIGIAEVHQRPQPKGTQAPANMDGELARMFFHPTRDQEGILDDALLLNPNTIEPYYLSFVSSSLLELFNNDSLQELYEDIVRALVDVLHHPKMTVLSYFDDFIARLLTVLERGSDNEIQTLLPLFSSLISNSTHNASPFLKRSLEFIHTRYNDTNALLFIDLILALLTAVRDGYSPYASETICLLVVTLENKKTTDALICSKVLKAFGLIGVYSADLLYLTIPQICDAIITEQTLPGVRIHALETLIDLTKSVDLLPYLGPIARSLRYSLKHLRNDPKTISTAFDLLYTILKSQGLSFLMNAQPILDFLKKEKLETKELKQLVANVSQGKYGDCFHPLNINNPPPPAPTMTIDPNKLFSADAIIAKTNDADHMGRHLEGWLNSFILCIISNSPSQPIRACTSLATSYRPLAKKLFNVAFLCVWRKLEFEARQQLSDFFKQLLSTADNYESIARDIINLIVFMDKVEQPMNIPTADLVKACTRYGSMAYALRLQQRIFEQQQKISSNTSNFAQVVNNLIDIYVPIGQWQNAVGVWEKCRKISPTLSRPDVLAKLRMWDQVEPICQEQFETTHSFQSYIGLVESLAALSKWERLMELQSEFSQLEVQQKRIAAPYFAEAALHLGRWDDLAHALKFAPDDSWRCRVLSSVVALHNEEYDKVDSQISTSFSLLASRPVAFWADNQQIHQGTMLACQELIEISEMREWLKNPERRTFVNEVWNQRLKTAKRDFNQWNAILPNQVRATSVRDDTLVQFFSLRGATLGQQIHLNAFNILFPKFDPENSPDAQKLCHSIALWNVGQYDEAIQEVRNHTLSFQGNMLLRANFFYSSWLLEHDGENLQNLRDAYNHLITTINEIDDSKIIKNTKPVDKKYLVKSSLVLPSPIYKELIMHTTQIDMIRKWSDVNVSLITFDPERKVKYAINAITALSRCAKLSPSFPDGVQMLNIFFEHAGNDEIFMQTYEMIQNLPSKLLLAASPQIQIQLSHNDDKVRSFVHNLVFSLLEVHFHDLVFSLNVLRRSRIVARAKAAGEILDRLHAKLPEIFNEVQLIRSSLLRAAVTWNEKVVQKITDVFDLYQNHEFGKMINILKSIISMVSHPSCELHTQFISQYSKNITMLEQILKIYTPGNSSCINQLAQWCKSMQDSLSEELKRTRTIQLSAISDELARKNDFMIAVFGTYKPNKPVNRIKFFVGQLSVYMSKQQPKDVVIKGEDGNFYQYLLKGHEDLRLDERIMQFFRMINSLLMKDSSLLNGNPIQTVSVIPLSMSHGLVQWATGTDTLRAVIEQFRRLHHRDPMDEYIMIDDLANGGYDILLPIQKVAILEKVFDSIPDTDLADFFWLKAPNAETWLKQVQTYSISTAITSIVGYVIGLGDRHPSNLLIDRNSGKVVHIDFGDSFDRAALRKYLPEVVPFRLTRMMVKALGAGGVRGIFKTSFVNMSSILRENREVLLNVISIFVHEPLIDPDVVEESQIAWVGDESLPFSSKDISKPNEPIKEIVKETGESYRHEELVSSNEEIKAKIRQKLTGNDFPETSNGEPLSVEDQATILINRAINIYSFSKMYSGWCPFW